MRKLVTALVMFAMLQGCAGNAIVKGGDADLSTLQLFGDAQPHFTVDLACSGASVEETRQCLTVSNEFYAWAGSRHIRLHSGGLDDPPVRGGTPVAGTPDQPYRIVVRFQPYFQATMLAGTAGTYIPGEVGYRGAIQVIDTSSGQVLRDLPLQERQVVPDRVNISDFIRADADAVIAKIDPGYSP
jgi:hypothetical protein